MFVLATVMFILGGFSAWGGTRVLISDRSLPSWVFGLGSKFQVSVKLWLALSDFISPGFSSETSTTYDSFDMDTDVLKLTDECHWTKIACIY